MRTFWLILCLVVALPSSADEILVLRNGKKIKLTEPHQVKGTLVIFKDAKGQLIQVPVKMVDFAQSKTATEALNQAAAAPKPTQQEVPPSEEQTLADIARDSRERAAVQPANINGNTLDRYARSNPRTHNSSMPRTGGSSYDSSQQYDGNQTMGDDERQRLRQEISRLEKEIERDQK